ncbi:transporter substrate-binding domain-containing protein [Endozoicomonas sp. SM1973]|uniref:Transporter substrate-binding domain-containing protein n=1 Tax=Spartinivicinus marinus TaxID=2994442 RepID=A0A853IGF0_9GAMM|nr:transporter substrate-binding domain-containing protein [Spartinivicinus marinus]NYZ69618.1 transporter substrate-binding domain-containing protein [Spartinivicinus marinus]
MAQYLHLFISIVILLSLSAHGVCENIWHISTGPDFETDIDSQVISIVVKQAYELSKEKVRITSSPSWKRSLIEANAGRVDGELYRIKGISKKFPNLVIIPIPVGNVSALAFTNKEKLKSLKIDSWNSLINHSIGILNGILYIEDESKKNNLKMIEKVQTYDQLLNVVYFNRVDFGVWSYPTYLSFIKDKRFNQLHIFKTPLSVEYLYHYIHKKNKNLIVKLTNALGIMQENGEIKKIRKEFIDQLYK